MKNENIYKKIVTRNLKGHGNEPNFPRFLHKLVRHGSLTLPFEPFRLLRRIRGDIRNRKTTPRLNEPLSLDRLYCKYADAQFRKKWIDVALS